MRSQHVEGDISCNLTYRAYNTKCTYPVSQSCFGPSPHSVRSQHVEGGSDLQKDDKSRVFCVSLVLKGSNKAQGSDALHHQAITTPGNSNKNNRGRHRRGPERLPGSSRPHPLLQKAPPKTPQGMPLGHSPAANVKLISSRSESDREEIGLRSPIRPHIDTFPCLPLCR